MFEQEPIERGHPFTTLTNMVLTPHIGGGTVEAMHNVLDKACRHINHFHQHGSFYDEKDIVNLSALTLKDQ
ncbi:MULTISPECIES: hypothetical protein [Paenibacillus]|uniref:hypothetical protein n=1 Tax=Paenibacillus TaxID=44249 RepID=UPI001F1D6F4C|nr:hypothetical protein [Paenibacillus sp. EPM92]